MKILIYGFKPFKKYKKNISEEIVKRLNKRKYIKVILPIVYKKKYILNKIKKHQPDIIIGFGQTGRKLIKIERKAKNTCEKERPKVKEKINLKGPKQYLVNLKLRNTLGTRISYNAGEYLCNFSMYVVLDFIKKKRLKTKFAFIHIPKNYGLRKAVKVVKKLLLQINEGG